MSVDVQGPSRRSPLLLIAAVAGLLSLSACDDDSQVTPDAGTTLPGTGATQVDDVTGGDGPGTVLPGDTSPGATDAPNPNAGGGAGTGTNVP
jgi:hypothetical protein